MLRKFAALLCVAAMSFVFVGCEAESAPDPVTPPPTMSETTTDTDPVDEMAPADDAAAAPAE